MFYFISVQARYGGAGQSAGLLSSLLPPALKPVSQAQPAAGGGGRVPGMIGGSKPKVIHKAP